MHRRAEFGERIGGPVPPVGRLPHHLRRLAGTRHHLSQHVTVVENPYRFQMFAGLAHPHQHRAASMQIHTDKLPTLIEFAHRGLLRRNNVSTPSIALGTDTRSGGPAPSSHQRRFRTRAGRLFAYLARVYTATGTATKICQLLRPWGIRDLPAETLRRGVSPRIIGR